MDPVVRRIEPAEAPAFRRSVMIPFLEPFANDPDQVADFELWAGKHEPDRSWVVDDGGRFVGNAAIHSMNVTLPAAPGQPCPTMPMAGVSAVGVHPTHRRRGFLAELMEVMHDDARRRGEALAGLEASESAIYGRFGYGVAATVVEYSIDSRVSAFEIPAPALEIRLLDKEEALAVLPELFDRQRRTRAGEVDRSPGFWAHLLADRPSHRGGLGPRFHAVCDEGYVLYRSSRDTNVFRADRSTIVIEELRGTTPEVEAALWRFVLDLDLVGQVNLKHGPVDEPLRWRLADPRQLKTVAVEDRLYVRVLDVVPAFESRGYQAEGRLVVEVRPPAASSAIEDPVAGRWAIEAGPEGASCRPARPSEGSDIRLEIASLGSLLMGGFPASVLAAGGRIEELRSGALHTADSLFTTRPAPRSGTEF